MVVLVCVYWTGVLGTWQGCPCGCHHCGGGGPPPELMAPAPQPPSKSQEGEQQGGNPNLTVWSVMGELIAPFSRSFIQVDNELKYLVDGVAIHMNEADIPLDTLAGVAHHCLQSHSTLPGDVLPPQPCPTSHVPLNVRDCDPGLGGQLPPQICCQLLYEARPTEENEGNTCLAELCSPKSCVTFKLLSLPNSPCVPPHLHPNLIHSTSFQERHHGKIHLKYVNLPNMKPRVRIVHVKEGLEEDMESDPIFQSRHYNPPYCSNGENQPDPLNLENEEVDCWDLSDEGPQPGMDCYLTPLWLPTQIIKTGETEIRYGDIIDDKGVPSKNYIVFDPPHLDFKEHPTGMPLMRKVVVQNSSPETSVQLHSLSGNTLHFHCTFFQDKVVLPGGNTSFDVVFLGREEGLIENTIFIHTSIGTYKYGVRAVGTGNPYRLRPLVGVRMPLNSSYSPLIQLHNPHPHSLQITEMYSTGGDLHLELLSGSQEGQKNLWNIPPYHTRPLMRANFVARRENNHTAYVRIVTSETNSDYLVVPVEVEVSGQPGLFCPHDGLHFGLRTPHDPPTTLPLHLLNSAHKHIHIQNVITTPVNDAITIDFKPMKIPPGTVRPTQVATVSFDPSKVTSGKKVSGKILIKSKVSAYKLSVPFTVDLLHGALLYNTSITKFYTGTDIEATDSQAGLSFGGIQESIGTVAGVLGGVVSSVSGGGGGSGSSTAGTSNPSSEARNLTLTNTFPCPVVIYNLTLPEEAKKHFEIGWSGAVVVEEGESAHVATLQLLSVGTNARLSTAITVHTNITTIKIPLKAYNGKLTKYIPPVGGDSWLDFGTLGMGDQRDIYFYVINENPVELRLRGWGSNLTRSAVELMGVEQGNITTIKQRNNMTYASKSLFLKPNHYAAFRIGVLTPDTEGIFIAESFVQTQFEQIKIPFRLRTADGSLSVVPDTIIFHNSFPGKISHQNLNILSTFGHPMTVKEVKPLPGDTRFSYEVNKSGSATLQPGQESHIGRLVFDPKLECGSDCYTGFSLTGKAGQQWVNTLSLTSHVADTDTSLYSTLRSRYLNLSSSIFNTSIVLHTSEVHGFRFTAQASLKWPSMCSPPQLTFPLTQVMNTSIQEVFVENPASVPVVAQILLLHHYPATQQLLSIIHHQLSNVDTLLTEDSGGGSGNEVFGLVDVDSAGGSGSGSGYGSGARGGTNGPTPASEITSGLAQHRRMLEEQFKTRVAKDSIAIILEPGAKVKVRLSFTPPDERTHSTVLLVRNNLTVIDAMLVQGRGGRGFLKFGNRKPGSSLPLAFNIGAKHLKDCDSSKSSKYYQPNFTVKRSFQARNTGELPVEVWGFSINELPCEGYGFKVLDCEGFQLAPNGSHKVDIAFTPDFTLSKIQQRLIIHTSLGVMEDPEEGSPLGWISTPEPGRVEYSMVATVPTHLLAECGAAVPRPTWEPLLYYAVLALMLAMLGGAVILAALEADHILKTTIVAMTTSMPANGHNPGFDKSKVFDLRAISETKNISIRNGIANGHAHIENLKSNHLHSNNNNNNRKGQSPSSSGDVLSNGRKPSSGSSSKKFNNNQTLNSSTKSKYLKHSDSKLNTSNGDVYTAAAENSASQIQNKNSRKNNTKGNKGSESMSWTRFFRAAVCNEKDIAEDTDSSQNKKSSSSYNKDESAVQKQSVGTETDLHIVENFPKVRRRIKPSNEEETSSTTTESSNTDDLSISERDTNSSKSSDVSSSQSEKASKKRGNKAKSTTNKTQNSQTPRISTNQVEDNAGFEISTKVKGLKKLKDQGGRTFGGDIYQPNSLELPYTLKPVRTKDYEKDTPKALKTNTSKSGGNSGETAGSGGSSPTLNWEDSHQQSAEQDLPTSNLSGTHSKQQSQLQPLAPREPSYSAILLGTDKQKNKVTPLAKVPPEVKRVEKPLGVIGQKASGGSNTSTNLGRISGIPSSVTSVPMSSMQNSTLFTVPDNNYSHSMKEDMYGRSLYSGYVDSGPLAGSQASHSWDPKTLSVPTMRPPPGLVQPHDSVRHNSVTEEEWPRYASSQVGGSVWPEGGGYHQEGMNVNTSSAPAPSLWDSLPSIWSQPFWSNNQGTHPQVAQTSPWGTPAPQPSVASGNDASGAVSKGLGFNPFCSANIWSAPPNHPGDIWPPTSAKKDM
ncbi:hypothetical protein Pmani_026827 [Petrolisthes manimaculis]|uniref:Transmembrane protein 131 n=1 Tax=Petrolisthes manimaculis TaxID=1843537 RepID=A0AAE1P2R5_9EUCA|nr:hypothetical protein Pmani_026827 [Petrolisthes manimaculis]